MRTVLNGMILLMVFGAGCAATVDAVVFDKFHRTEICLSGEGWKLWRDVEAQWKNDELFLPPVDISKLPVNPPTGVWQAMYSGKEVISVSDEMQGGRKTDISSELGDYLGVSWWWRTLDVPAIAKGKRIFVKFENNWLRSEVFLNETLVGYEVSVTSPDFFLTLIGETCNLASELPAITNRLKKELDIWLYEINASMPELKTNKKNKI